MLLALLACRSPPAPPVPLDPPEPTASTGDSDGLPWSDDPCEGVTAQNDWTAALDTWDAQGPPAGSLLLTGSSSIRRWEHARRDLSAWGPVQRGLGGAWASDIAVNADRLVGSAPVASVVFYAGTNDLTGGAAPEAVVDSYRCFVERVFARRGAVPVVFVGITPNPARWKGWARAEQVNAAVRALSEQHPMLGYADMATPFLALGAPPPASLFVDDQLHLSEEGYALWTQVVVDALDAVAPRPVPEPASAPAEPFYVRVDLGPSNPEDGAPAPAIDGLGIHWNAWSAVDGDAQVLAGETLRDLRTTTGAPTGIGLVITGGFRTNGFANGGLVSPDGALLATLALPEATGDFFWTGGPDDPGGLSFYGLDPARRYTLRLFGSRASADEARSTRYTVEGAGTPVSTVLPTTGPGIGAGGGDGNDSTVAVLTGLAPDAWGELHVDVSTEAGAFAYLNLLELEAEP
ncbi:MAG: GDSL-type esterase/lipase family protein [Myxococcota bacterium]